MPTLHVYSGATGLNDGSSWTDAFTDVSSAFAAWNIGDRIWVAFDHYQTATALTLSSANDTETDPVRVESVDRTTNLLKRATSVQIDITGTSLNINVVCSINGMYFKGGSVLAFNPGIGGKLSLKDCTFASDKTSGTFYVGFNGPSANIIMATLDNCDIIALGNVVSYVQLTRAMMFMRGGNINYANTGTNGVFRLALGGSGECRGVDLSNTVVNNYLVYGAAITYGIISLKNCKIPSGLVLSGGNDDVLSVELTACDSAGNTDRYEFAGLSGNSIVTTTSIYRDSGYNGVDNQISYKMSKSNTLRDYGPLKSPPIIGYIDSTGSKILTIELAHDYSTNIKDFEAYLDLYYLGSAGSVLPTFETTLNSPPTNCTHDPITTGTDLATSTEAWIGAAGLTKQKISKAVTINKAGLYAVRFSLDKYEAGKFCYLDPKVSVA